MKKMKKTMMWLDENLFAAKWWNPLFWVAVLLLPVLSGVVMSVLGLLVGLLDGYKDGEEKSGKMLGELLCNLED